MITKKKKKREVWQDSYLWRVYELARSGVNNRDIHKTLGISPVSFGMFLKHHPELQEALDAGRAYKEQKKQHSFKDYVYKRLSPEMQIYWNKLLEVEENQSSVQMIESIIGDSGSKIRQQLFIHALIQCNFNASEACRLINISYTQLHHWMLTDPDFPVLTIDEMNWHKANFFEEALFDLVSKRDTAAVIFASRTFNKKRGYTEKIEIESNEKKEADTIDITQLDLPIETRRIILEALRARQDNLKKLPSPEQASSSSDE